jgi:general secretion pathway protein G
MLETTRKLARFSSCHNQGFSLIELLVVMAILTLLATLVGPQAMNYFGRAKGQTAQVQINNISNALELYRLDNGVYPRTEEGLQSLIRAPASAKTWGGPYLAKEAAIVDPWGNVYQYRSPGQHGAFDLFTLGRDNADGGSDEDRDVKNWE